MNGFLNKQPASAQLATLLGFFIGFFFLYSFGSPMLISAISGGYTLEELLSAVKKDSGLANSLKLAQFLYTFIVFLVPAALFLYLREPRPAAALGLNRPPSVYNLVFSLLIMAAALPLVAWLAEWNAGWPVGDTLRKIQESAEEGTKAMLAAKSIGDLLVNLLIAAVLPAIAEEVFFRGAMQRVFTGITGSGVAAVIITSIIFSAIHLEALGFVPRVALSMVLGFIYLFSGNLWLSIIAHFCNNALSVLLFYFNGNETESDESYAWYITALSALVVIALFAMMRRSNKNNVLSVSQHQNEE